MAHSNSNIKEPAVHDYQELLLRYASYIVRNRLVATMIVDEVLYKHRQDTDNMAPYKIRSYLQQRTRHCCQQWLRMKSRTLFLRKPKNPT